MKAAIFCTGLVVSLAATSASASIYSDSTGETISASIIDITSAEVTDDGSNIHFKINLAGDPVATDWGKYMVMIDTVTGGDNAGNGWARPIGWGQPGAGAGADYWLGSWADSGNGAENRKWNGIGWDLQDATYNLAPNNQISFVKDTPSVTISLPLARLGLGLDQQFCFDIFTSGGGGGDGAIDSLGNPNQQIANWGDYSVATPVCYVTTPEPSTLVLLGLGGLAFIRRRR